MNTVSSAPTMTTAAMDKIVGEVHSYSLPPQVVSRIRVLVVIAMAAKPIQSNPVKPCSPTGSFSTKAQTIIASRPSGMLIHRPQRQPGPSVNQPPRTGPGTEETRTTPPKMRQNFRRARQEPTQDPRARQ